jgi:hypothetical protein
MVVASPEPSPALKSQNGSPSDLLSISSIFRVPPFGSLLSQRFSSRPRYVLPYRALTKDRDLGQPAILLQNMDSALDTQMVHTRKESYWPAVRFQRHPDEDSQRDRDGIETESHPETNKAVISVNRCAEAGAGLGRRRRWRCRPRNWISVSHQYAWFAHAAGRLCWGLRPRDWISVSH